MRWITSLASTFFVITTLTEEWELLVGIFQCCVRCRPETQLCYASVHTKLSHILPFGSSNTTNKKKAPRDNPSCAAVHM